jgi:3-hydroxyacyl-CoA dehydrogenase/3-hydroxy-2-methylbutyryl-CoA dehydrogenase
MSIFTLLHKIIDADNNPHPLELWDFTLAVNLTGSFYLTRLVLQHLVRVSPEESADGERGIVILVSSAAAVSPGYSIAGNTQTWRSSQFEGQPGQTAYAATKGALLSMTLPLARELARHAIRVVTIAPGVFTSSMTSKMPEKTRRSLAAGSVVYPHRFGRPEEFAHTVRWITECPYVNGEVVRLSGGGRLPAKL